MKGVVVMRTFLIIVLSIDFSLLFIGKIIFYMRIYKVVSFKDFFSRINNALPEKKSEDKDKTKWKDKVWRKKIVSVLLFPFKLVIGLTVALFLIGLGLAIGLGIPTASIWGTIWLGSSVGMIWAVAFLIGLNSIYLFLGLWMLTASKVKIKSIKRVLIMDVIKFSMLLLTLYFVGFNFDLSIQNLTNTPYQWEVTLNNLASIFLPMIFYAILFTNIFALGVRFKNIFTKNRESHSIIRLHQIMFIFISACYIGILLIMDIDFSFMTESGRDLYFETLEVIKWIVTSVFIPLFIYTLNNFKKEIVESKRSRRDLYHLRCNRRRK